MQEDKSILIKKISAITFVALSVIFLFSVAKMAYNDDEPAKNNTISTHRENISDKNAPIIKADGKPYKVEMNGEGGEVIGNIDNSVFEITGEDKYLPKAIEQNNDKEIEMDFANKISSNYSVQRPSYLDNDLLVDNSPKEPATNDKKTEEKPKIARDNTYNGDDFLRDYKPSYSYDKISVEDNSLVIDLGDSAPKQPTYEPKYSFEDLQINPQEKPVAAPQRQAAPKVSGSAFDILSSTSSYSSRKPVAATITPPAIQENAPKIDKPDSLIAPRFELVDKIYTKPPAPSRNSYKPRVPKPIEIPQVQTQPDIVAPAIPQAPNMNATVNNISINNGILLQLGSYRSTKQVRDSWERIKSQFPNQLRGRNYNIDVANLGSRGVYYRLQVGGFSTKSEARKTCRELNNNGQDCLPIW